MVAAALSAEPQEATATATAAARETEGAMTGST